MTALTRPTAFGAVFAEPRQTAAVLRARAAAAQLDLRQCGPEDLLAAVVGAQTWMACLAATALTPVPGDAAAAAALAAVYCRAAGHAEFAVPAADAVPAVLRDLSAAAAERASRVSDEVLRAVNAGWQWALGHGAGPEVLLAAAHDLAAGWDSPRLACGVHILVELAAGAE